MFALSQSRKGATRWFFPTMSAFACIICHKVSEPLHGVRHIVVLSGCTSYGVVVMLPPIRQGQLPQD